MAPVTRCVCRRLHRVARLLCYRWRLLPRWLGLRPAVVASVCCRGGGSVREGGRRWFVCGSALGFDVAQLSAASAVVRAASFRHPLPVDGVGGCSDLGQASLIGWAEGAVCACCRTCVGTRRGRAPGVGSWSWAGLRVE